MTVRELLKKLRLNNIDVCLNGENLEIKSDTPQIPAQVLDQIRSRKAEIIEHFKNYVSGFTEYASIPKAENKTYYDLSSSQHRLWVLCQFEGVNVAYNISGVYIFEGDLNVNAMGQSFHALMERHEILRTVFASNEQGEIKQWIRTTEEMNFRITYHDLQKEEEQELKIRSIVQSEIERPFNLEKGPLLRAQLLRTGEKKCVFAYTMHHIISDGWSVGVMIHELLTLYNSFSKGQGNMLKPLKLQYKDYVAWQKLQLSGEKLQTHKTYWLDQFAGEHSPLQLVTDHPRPAVKTYNGRTLNRKLNAVLTKKLKELCREEEGTLFVGLLAVLNTLLYKYTGQTDIVVGSPIAGRDHVDLEDQIGFYINTLALRSGFNGKDTFRQLLENIKQVTLGAYEHQVYPFDELVGNLHLSRDMSRNALFDVMLILQNTSVSAAVEKLNTIADVKISAYKGGEYIVSKFDLSFDFEERESELHYLLEYNTDLYDASAMDRMSIHLEQLLESAVTSPDDSLDSLNYISENEKQKMLFEFNDTHIEYPSAETLTSLFEKQVILHPDTTAVVFKDRNFTYSEINQLSNRLAHYLKENYAIGNGDLVCLKLDRSEWMIISILGVLKCAAAYVPVDPDYPQERVDYIMSDTKSSVLIDESELEKFRAQQINYSKENTTPISKPSDLAYVIYTSGSTGQPKGCMLEHSGIVNVVDWMYKQYAYSMNDVMLFKTTYTFDVSIPEIFMPLCWGTKMVICEKEDVVSPGKILSLIEKEKITSLGFVPSMLNVFISSVFDNENIGTQLKSLRMVSTIGEALSAETVKQWYEKTEAPLHNLYGPTEASVQVCYYATQKGDKKIPIGKPISNTQIYILDTNQKLTGHGVSGEICIGGDGLARGYLNKEKLTKEKFIDNPFKIGERIYRTGDLGRWLEDGNIEYLGRMDDQVKIRGYRIELGEIENALKGFEGVESAVVIARADSSGDKSIVAYIMGKSGLSVAELRNYLIARLPAYMIPSHFVQVEEIPLTANGKVNRKALPDPNVSGIETGVVYVAPGTATEEHLVKIWSEVLEKDESKIGVSDNFFELGGDSLKIIRLSKQISKIFNKEITVAMLFQYTTVQDLAGFISNETETVEVEEELDKNELLYDLNKFNLD